MRHLVAILGGVMLVGGLFALLAMLVSPPDDTPTLDVPAVSLAMVEAPTQQSASAAPTPTPPAPSVAPPPPAPEPAPQTQSAISLPDPELPAEPQASPPSEMTLPDLEEQRPDPEPTPEPMPEPEPRNEPAEPVTDTEPAEPQEVAAANGRGESANEATEDASSQEVTAAPRPTRKVPPQYPSRAQRRGLQGHVVVAFTIRPGGEVDRDSITVVEADPARVFDRAARRAIAGWEFPASGSPRRVRQRLEFKLR
ncbi:energy transducer TonB [Onishia niordana]|uniref:energy transducer TonB n=1 Tax=Onishia niordana TaxID=2508711 RepID=UPI00109F45D6|nr:energy transducer TonB [Halomonas niordiana]